MNKKQKIVLWIGIAVIVAMGLFPPWIYSIPAQTIETPNPTAAEQRAKWRAEHPIGIDLSDLVFPDTTTQHIYPKTERHYYLVFAPLKGQPVAVRCSLDIGCLLIQWAMVALVTSGLIYTFKDRKDQKLKDEQKQ